MTPYNLFPCTPVPFGLRHPRLQAAVFLCTYCTDGLPHAKYMPPQMRHSHIPHVLLQQRWDGYTGTFGGKVDPGESLLDGLIRELQEEANYNLSDSQLLQLQPLSSLDAPSLACHIHSWALQVPRLELEKIARNALSAKTAFRETAGVQLAHAFQYPPSLDDRPRGLHLHSISNIPWSATAGLEFEKVLSLLP